jgi:hypothetical protein
MTKYSLVAVEDMEEWDAFSARSPQCSVFFQSRYLDATGSKYVLYFVKQGQQNKAGVALILSDDGSGCELDSLVIYNGILFEDAESSKLVKARMERFELTLFIIDALNERYTSIAMALSPAFEDLRPFLWHNYHSPNLVEKFRIDLRYTSFLDISEFFLRREDTSTRLFKNLDKNRQSDLRKAQGRLFFEETCDSERFIQYYDELLLSQGTDSGPAKLGRIRNLIDSTLREGLARMFAVKNSQGHVTYMTVFSFFQNHGCYLFAAGDQHSMQRYDGTFCVWESMKALSQSGVYLVDLEGVNSPQRGAFKLGFGGDMRPYFKVSKPTTGPK